MSVGLVSVNRQRQYSEKEAVHRQETVRPRAMLVFPRWAGSRFGRHWPASVSPDAPVHLRQTETAWLHLDYTIGKQKGNRPSLRVEVHVGRVEGLSHSTQLTCASGCVCLAFVVGLLVEGSGLGFICHARLPTLRIQSVLLPKALHLRSEP